MEKSITQITRSYILGRPSIRDCLSRGLVNHSALARQICNEMGIESFDAVLAAAKRFRISPDHDTLSDRVRSLLASAQLRVTNQIAVVVVETPRDFERLLALQRDVRRARGRFNLIDGDEVVTLIVSQQHLGQIRVALRHSIQHVSAGLAQINLLFDREIETTPGVVAFVYGLLAFHGVNVLEEMSCWTDLIVVIDEKDIPRAMEVLGNHS